jgi:hypothetical protein
MTMMPILVLRASAGISHNIAQDCQVARSASFENNTFAPVERAQRSAGTACKVTALLPVDIPDGVSTPWASAVHTVYKPDYCPIAYKFCLLGATNEDLAGLFEVCLSTIGYWLRRYPAFKKAVQEGRDVADADVAHSLLQKAKGFTNPDVKILQVTGEAQEVPYNRYFPPDTQAAIFWLRNRHQGAQCLPSLISTRRSIARSAPSATIP